MNKNVVIGIAVLVIVLGGGLVYYQSTQNKATQSPTPMQGNQMMEGTSKMSPAPTTEAASPSAGAQTTGTAAKGSVKEFVVENKGMTFTPNKLQVNKGDTVKITFKNTGGFHDFVIDEFDAKTEQISAGKEDNVEFVADQAGSFEFYCSVGNHRQMGMKGTLTVK